jgi:hypothetical protein
VMCSISFVFFFINDQPSRKIAINMVRMVVIPYKEQVGRFMSCYFTSKS